MARLGQRRTPASIESGFELRARREHFADVPVEIGRVFERGRQAGQGQRVHAVGREHAAHPAHQLDRAGEQAEAQAGKSVGLGKGARDDEIGNVADQIDHRFAVEVEVGFIDQQHGVRRAASDLEKLRARGDGAGRAVGIGDGDDFGARRDGGEQALEGKLKIVGGLHRDDARVGRRRVDLIHGVSGHGQQQLIAGFEKGLEEDVNGFVDAVGERHLLWARGRDARRRWLRPARARDSA